MSHVNATVADAKTEAGVQTMTKREWRQLNETLTTEAQAAEAERRWAVAAACWVALADLREDELGSPLRQRAGECWSRASRIEAARSRRMRLHPLAEGDGVVAATKHLVGRKVVRARYMLHCEAMDLGWGYRSVVLEFDDGTIAFVAGDDEANDAGTLFVQTERAEICIGQFPA